MQSVCLAQCCVASFLWTLICLEACPHWWSVPSRTRAGESAPIAGLTDTGDAQQMLEGLNELNFHKSPPTLEADGQVMPRRAVLCAVSAGLPRSWAGRQTRRLRPSGGHKVRLLGRMNNIQGILREQ